MVAAPAKSFAWELAKDADGIRVYTRTIPGSGFKEYKAQVTIRSSLSSLVALVDDIGACPKWIDTCAKGKLLKRINPRESYTYTINHAPWPVSDRDAVVHNIIRQEPGSRIVTIQIKGISDYVPEKPDLVRVKRLKGFWRFTPFEDGSVRVTYQVHSEPGGNLPSWLINSVVVTQPFRTLQNMRKVVGLPKYQRASYPFLKE
jgi:ribosome-associated toxin RatA of RatAB toxin-antitoxin module